MKKQCVTLVLSFVLFAGILSACMTDAPPPPAITPLETPEPPPTIVPLETPKLPPGTTPTSTPLPMEVQTWQDTYAELLRGLIGKEFFLCDIDKDGIPELLTGEIGTDKYAEYDVYIYRRHNRTYRCCFYP